MTPNAPARPTFTLPPVPALIASMFSLQFGASLAKHLFPVVGATGTTFLRVGLSAIVLLLVLRTPLRSLTGQQWRSAALYGTVLGLMNLSFYASIQTLPLGLAVALEFLGPLGVAVWSSRRAIDYLWVALAGFGIFLITPLTGQGHIDPHGLMYVLLAAIFWAAYIVLGTRMSAHFSGAQGVSVGLIFATVIAGLGALVLHTPFSHLTPTLLLMGLGVAFLSSAVPYSLEMVAMRALPRHIFSVLLSLEPAVAALTAYFVLHERLSLLQVGAMVCIIAASVGVTVAGQKEQAGPGFPDSHG